MSARGILLLASLSMGAAGCVAYAQPYPPPGPPPDQSGYDQGQGYPSDQGYSSDQGYGDPGYQDQGAYADQGNDQGYDQGYDQDTQDAYSGQPVSVDYFYRQLSPYGEWIQRPSYGWVWYPAHVPAGWRPYRYGRWVDTEYGWTWASQEQFGWATYHYGRWTLDPEYGWVWVPGTEWGPAWVAFQQGNGYVGWAPLPPSVGFRAGFGLDFGGINLNVSIGPSWYNFVPERQFLAASVSSYCLPPARNVTIIRNTTNITSYRMVNNRIVNQSVPVQRIEQVTGQRVQRFRVADATATTPGRTPRIQGNQITVFRPRVSTAKPVVPPPQAIAQQRPARNPRQPGRIVQPGTQPPQPGNARQPGNTPQAVNAQQPTPRQGNGRYRRPATPEEVQRQNAQEQADLAKHQADEQRQIDQMHRQEQEQARNKPAQATEVQRRQQAEAQALQEQHQREQQQLEAKHQREQQNVRSRQQQQPPQPQQQPPPRQNQDKQNQDKNKNNQDKSKDRNKPQDEQKPPPQR